MGEFSRVYKTDLTDRQIMDFWRMVQLACRDRDFAYCLPPMDGHGFVQWMRRDDVHPWGLLYRGIPVGMSLLTDRRGKTAEIHFCTLPMGLRRASGIPMVKALGLFALAQILWERNKSGRFVLDTLIGITPVSNKAACKYALSLGGQAVARVPGACWYYDTNENVDGFMTVFTRDNVPHEFVAL